MKDLVLYIHGKGGSAAESERYRPLFPGCAVIGLDYQTCSPWETGTEIFAAVTKLKEQYESITLIANSIGAYFSMHAGIDSMIRKAYFISPIVDMERLILDMMHSANVTEERLQGRRASSQPTSARICRGTICAMCVSIPSAGQCRPRSSMEAATV